MKKVFNKEKLKKILNKENILNLIIVLIVISLYVFVFMSIYFNFRERKRKEISKGIINKIDNVIKENIKEDNHNNKTQKEAKVSYNNFEYTVLGKLIIQKIKINEPILKENTKLAYDTALVKMSGPDLNSFGNVAIGGHNFMKGDYFIKINKLVNDDKVTIVDLSGNSIDYFVYEYKVVPANDSSYLEQPEDKNDKIVTLVTCTKGGKERYIVKAKAK